MDWQVLKDKVYYSDGSWRDIYIHNTTKEDWQLWADFVNKNYKTSFSLYETEIGEATINLTKVFEYWDRIHEYISSATVYVDNLQVNANFFRESEMENDIRPNEFNSIEDHNNLMEYMIKLSKLLNKTVVLTPENASDFPLITVFKDNIRIHNY